MKDHFSRQDNKWKKVLRRELSKQTKREVHDKYRELLGWSPELRNQPTVIETINESIG